nr:NADH dehydrogenase subunit 5 [Rhabdosynochus viridisi]
MFLLLILFIFITCVVGYFLDLNLMLGDQMVILLNLSLNNNNSFCIFMLLVCSSCVVIFNSHYFSFNNYWLCLIIVFFVFIMINLVLSNSLILSLIGWEYLGVVSFFLILFYSNFDTFHAGNTTLISSRFGDVSLFFIIGLCSTFLLNSNVIFLLVCFFFVVASKSATFPLSSWLIEAMRAPTPVSSLVHSSTLVAAGVWFLSNYSYLSNNLLDYYLLCFCSVTILLCNFGLLNYGDLKKLIALSTCNNINWCIVFNLLGLPLLSLIQLLVHGISKCLLFCNVGDCLNSNLGNQLSLNSVSSGLYSLYNSSFIGILLLSLSGFIFNGVYFSKHLFLLLNNWNNNIIFMILLLLLVLGSYCYSFRLFFIFYNYSTVNNVSSVNVNFNIISFIFLLPVLLNYFIISSFSESYLIFLLESLIIFFLPLLGLFIGYFYSWHIDIKGWNNLFGGQDIFINLVYYLNNFLTGKNLALANFSWELNLLVLINNLSKFLLFLANINIFFVLVTFLVCYIFFV